MYTYIYTSVQLPILVPIHAYTVVCYFYERLKTSLHKPTGNLIENLFSKKCAFRSNLQLLEKKFMSQTNKTPKNGILINKMARLLKSSIFQ